jgi:hypothetical protein
MNSETRSPTWTVTALYADKAAADRTVDRLKAEGVPEGAITMHSAGDEGASAEEQAGPGPSNSFLAGIYDFFMPELDRSSYKTGLERGSVMLVVKDVSDALETRVVSILDIEAEDIEEHAERDEPGPEDDTAIQYSGAGSATGERDRLTGERIGAPEGQAPDEPVGPAGSSAGQATGEYDRLTGERIGARHRGEEPIPASGDRPRRVRLYPM